MAFALRMRWIAGWLWMGWMCSLMGLQAQSATKAELWTDKAAVRSGSRFTAAVRLRMDEGWHIYWRNPGDEVGLKTRIEWTLPPGVRAGEIQWPAPEKTIEKEFETLTYSGTVLLTVPMEVPSDHPAGPLALYPACQRH